jgi:colicin import membrane protein
MQVTTKGLHKAVIKFDDNTIICEAESKSYRYARKKAMKTALQILSKITFDKYTSETGYLEIVKKRIEDEKAEYRKQIEAKIAEKKKQQAERSALNKKIKKAKDIERRRAKAASKKRKQELAKLKAEKEKNKKPLSVAKRRFLEDKKQ